ncbi:rhomboid family intramembrane serine protease [Microvirga makkahensis]|uniref:Rhomboid family intramembrane serine protease n=1 Tax=Microvirga makkahensis TaxID=1128670 RepID=A0A7X3MN88_9HYPH|nr:rhomboid family intramembrane serine protease [Microvirga makkahensis]MXQ09940.1 rhomboid family intramembrane serine protease [Microvirga makkahensis]
MPVRQPRVREPVLNLPSVVTVSILALVAIHAFRMFLLSDETDFQTIVDWAVIPARWSVAYGGVDGREIVRMLQESAPEDALEPIAAFALYVLGDGEGRPWTALTYGLLHGSWGHVLINSIWLAAFGTPIARRCGTGRFLLLSALSAVGGAVLYVGMNPMQVFPLIGASGAVSGLMAAAAWFMFAPAAWHWEGRLTEPHERPRQPLGKLARNRPFLIFLGVWFATNYLFAVVQPIGVGEGTIAWEAHVGGFLVGLLVFPWLDPLPAQGSRISA